MVRETASALAGLGLDPAGLVTACRRIVERHPASGPLWWFCARTLTAADPLGEAWRCVEAIEEDTTGQRLAAALPDDALVCVVGWPDHVSEALTRRGDLTVLAVESHPDAYGFARHLRRTDVSVEEVPSAGLAAAAAAAALVLVEAEAIGPDGFVAPPGTHAAAAVAYCAEVPVWLVGGVGRLLPAQLWQAVVSRLGAECEPWELDHDVVPLSLASSLCGPAGPETVADGLRRLDCPVAPELLRTSPF
jgi:Initiation factor 2 subunit family